MDSGGSEMPRVRERAAELIGSLREWFAGLSAGWFDRRQQRRQRWFDIRRARLIRRGELGPWALRHAGLVVSLALGGAALFAWWAMHPPAFLIDADGLNVAGRSAARASARDLSLKIAAGVLAIGAGGLTWGRLELSKRDALRERSRVDAERFGRALDQLAHSSIEQQLGGVYMLESFVDSLAYKDQTREVLAATIRRLAPVNSEPVDVQASAEPILPGAAAAALEVLLRHRWNAILDLRAVRLHGLDLDFDEGTEADLTGSRLSSVQIVHRGRGQFRLRDVTMTRASWPYGGCRSWI